MAIYKRGAAAARWGKKKGVQNMPKTIEEMEKELLRAVRNTRIELAKQRGFRHDATRDAIHETMHKRPELFDQLREAVGVTRFEHNPDIALWLKEEIAKKRAAKKGD
jgi:hypothetical protein